MDCEKPLRVVCRHCAAETVWACSNHRESRCRPCAARYRRRLVRVAEVGMDARVGGFLYMVTLTAPGRRLHHQADGSECPCTPAGGVDLGEWNASHSRRWNHLRTVLRRDIPDLEYLRAVEVQGRGALHDHAIMWSPVPLTVLRIRPIAIRAGFGHSVDVAPIDPGSRKAAYYVGKYVTKSCDSREDVPWMADVIDCETGEVTRRNVSGRYRTWSSSRQWGITMKEVRALLAAAAARRARLGGGASGGCVAEQQPDDEPPPHDDSDAPPPPDDSPPPDWL
jgi:hypothetical protein